MRILLEKLMPQKVHIFYCRFAKLVKNDELKRVKTRPVKLTIRRLDSKISGRIDLINVDIVVKIFLNGTKHASDCSVSVCASIVNKSAPVSLKNKEVIVSLFLKHPNGAISYRKDFKTKLSVELEENEKGVLDFISKEEFRKYISPDDVTLFGVMVHLAPYGDSC